MRLGFAAVAVGIALGGVQCAHAQAGPNGLTPLPQPLIDPNALPLYAGVAPGSENAKQVEAWAKAARDVVARNVTRPTITPVLPVGKASGAAVVVMPGGGNVVLSMGKEGYDVATFLANHGVAAFVVKYRVNETPADMSKMIPMAVGAVGAPAPSGAAAAQPPPPRPPQTGPRFGVEDGKQALRWVRAHAKEYGVDPKRVGMVGFSAGAGNIWGVVTADDPTARPDFVAPIYGGYGLLEHLPPAPPPLFLAGAADDQTVKPVPGFPIVEQWTKAGGKVELHFYQNGSHGFGALMQGTTSDLFMEEFLLWMQVNGFAKPQ